MAKDVISIEIRWNSEEEEYQVGVAVNGEWKEAVTLNRVAEFESDRVRAEFVFDEITNAIYNHEKELSGILKSPKIVANDKMKDEPDKTSYYLSYFSHVSREFVNYYGTVGRIARVNAKMHDDEVDVDEFKESQFNEFREKVMFRLPDLVTGATQARRARIAYNL